MDPYRKKYIKYKCKYLKMAMAGYGPTNSPAILSKVFEEIASTVWNTSVELQCCAFDVATIASDLNLNQDQKLFASLLQHHFDEMAVNVETSEEFKAYLKAKPTINANIKKFKANTELTDADVTFMTNTIESVYVPLIQVYHVQYLAFVRNYMKAVMKENILFYKFSPSADVKRECSAKSTCCKTLIDVADCHNIFAAQRLLRMRMILGTVREKYSSNQVLNQSIDTLMEEILPIMAEINESDRIREQYNELLFNRFVLGKLNAGALKKLHTAFDLKHGKETVSL